ncbi:competence type IV pilus major pilin ComGC [Kineosporia sp. A_224]|uniref:competence type IV pilus major pilin ComGC n=1 Tax=Kineosporia sp. A_224 TaxID=1962180 RepID=UPI000B4B58FF|nr:prepilin-type N-terminal cleavage/methylation domain-containing protein [Kineosporia sp. A_224]
MLRHKIREARQEGFTLIELLIVIVVLGILAGIVVFGVSTFRADAQTAACSADQKTVQVASDAYNAAKGGFASAIGTGTYNGTPAGTTLVSQGYLKAAPTGTTLGYAAGTGAVTITSCP